MLMEEFRLKLPNMVEPDIMISDLSMLLLQDGFMKTCTEWNMNKVWLTRVDNTPELKD